MNLLLALVKHYDTLENQDKSKVPSFGWTNAKAHFAVELNDDGSIDDILALGGHDKKNRGVVFEVPVRRARTSTPVPYLFCDTAQYILGNVSSTSKPGTYLSMKNAVLAFRGDLGESPALNAAYKFFETWDPEKALQNKFVASAMAFKDAETSTFILFYEGSPIFDDETFRTAYEEIVEKYGEFPIQADRNGNVSITAAPAHMRSMITGEDGLKAKLFRPVSVRGKMTYILSNNKANTNYFGRMQGDAIPVTMQDGHKIVEAAKALIGSKNCYFLPVTSQSLYTKCVIVWSDEVTKPEEDEMLRIWFGNESEAEKTDNIMRLAKARRGRVDILQECDKSKVVNVWQLSVPDKGCSASSFTQTTVGEVLANCIKHYEDMEINRSEACKNADGTKRDYARPDSIILALSAMNKDNSIVPINNQMWMQLNNCVYNGGKYPSQLLPMIYERICKDALKAPAGTMYIIPPTLAGAIKAILIRNYKEDITVSLNPNNTSPAYITGRIFALLVSGQHAIVPENQSQYDKRFLSRVVTNPVKVMPTIQMNFMQLKNRAQKSNRMGTYNAINNQIMDLIDMLDGNYPGRLTQAQRGEFFIGYNQQMHYNRDAAIAKKREKEENTIAMSAVNTVATVDETTVA